MIDQSLDAVAQGIERFVDDMLYLPASDAGDHGLTTALLNVLANGFAIIALVAKHLFRIAVDIVHQRRNGGDIVGLAGRDHDADGQALGVGACIDLGREAAARTAERVTLGSPFPPAAQ